MPQDNNGNELAVGDVVVCRFRITNFVADSDKLNLLAEHFKGHRGLPDDWRIALESRQVSLYQGSPIAQPQEVAAIAEPEESAAAEPVEVEGSHSHHRKPRRVE
jgi:hypothetical protein